MPIHPDILSGPVSPLTEDLIAKIKRRYMEIGKNSAADTYGRVLRKFGAWLETTGHALNSMPANACEEFITQMEPLTESTRAILRGQLKTLTKTITHEFGVDLSHIEFADGKRKYNSALNGAHAPPADQTGVPVAGENEAIFESAAPVDPPIMQAPPVAVTVAPTQFAQSNKRGTPMGAKAATTIASQNGIHINGVLFRGPFVRMSRVADGSEPGVAPGTEMPLSVIPLHNIVRTGDAAEYLSQYIVPSLRFGPNATSCTFVLEDLDGKKAPTGFRVDIPIALTREMVAGAAVAPALQGMPMGMPYGYPMRPGFDPAWGMQQAAPVTQVVSGAATAAAAFVPPPTDPFMARSMDMFFSKIDADMAESRRREDDLRQKAEKAESTQIQMMMQQQMNREADHRRELEEKRAEEVRRREFEERRDRERQQAAQQQREMAMMNPPPAFMPDPAPQGLNGIEMAKAITEPMMGMMGPMMQRMLAPPPAPPPPQRDPMEVMMPFMQMMAQQSAQAAQQQSAQAAAAAAQQASMQQAMMLAQKESQNMMMQQQENSRLMMQQMMMQQVADAKAAASRPDPLLGFMQNTIDRLENRAEKQSASEVGLDKMLLQMSQLKQAAAFFGGGSQEAPEAPGIFDKIIDNFDTIGAGVASMIGLPPGIGSGIGNSIGQMVKPTVRPQPRSQQQAQVPQQPSRPVAPSPETSGGPPVTAPPVAPPPVTPVPVEPVAVAPSEVIPAAGSNETAPITPETSAAPAVALTIVDETPQAIGDAVTALQNAALAISTHTDPDELILSVEEGRALPEAQAFVDALTAYVTALAGAGLSYLNVGQNILTLLRNATIYEDIYEVTKAIYATAGRRVRGAEAKPLAQTLHGFYSPIHKVFFDSEKELDDVEYGEDEDGEGGEAAEIARALRGADECYRG